MNCRLLAITFIGLSVAACANESTAVTKFDPARDAGFLSNCYAAYQNAIGYGGYPQSDKDPDIKRRSERALQEKDGLYSYVEAAAKVAGPTFYDEAARKGITLGGLVLMEETTPANVRDDLFRKNFAILDKCNATLERWNSQTP